MLHWVPAESWHALPVEYVPFAIGLIIICSYFFVKIFKNWDGL